MSNVRKWSSISQGKVESISSFKFPEKKWSTGMRCDIRQFSIARDDWDATPCWSSAHSSTGYCETSERSCTKIMTSCLSSAPPSTAGVTGERVRGAGGSGRTTPAGGSGPDWRQQSERTYAAVYPRARRSGWRYGSVSRKSRKMCYRI